MATVRRSLFLCANSIRGSASSNIARQSTGMARVLRIVWQYDVRNFTSSRTKWQQAQSQQAGNGLPVIDRTRSKLFKDADEAVADLKSGSTIFSAGFGLCGTAGMLSDTPFIQFENTVRLTRHC